MSNRRSGRSSCRTRIWTLPARPVPIRRRRQGARGRQRSARSKPRRSAHRRSGGRDQPVTGTVTRTASALDPGTRTLLIEVDVPNASHVLLPGMFVYANFDVAPMGTRWRIPATAVMFDAQGTRVAVVGADDTVH